MTVVTNPACTPAPVSPESATSEEEEYNFEDIEEENRPIVCRDYLLTPPPSWCTNLVRYYNEELACDVEFLAGYPGDQWRFPGHRKALAENSPIFNELLKANPSDTVVIDYVDRRGFEQLLRYMYCEPNRFDSVRTARSSLDVGYKFLCAGFVERAAQRLDEMMNASLALELLPDLRYMCAMLPGAASAPQLQMFEDTDASQRLARCCQWCDSLAHNALLVIDDNADEVLQDERFIDLFFEDVALIVRRETLRVSSELVIIEALARWSTGMCHKFKRELTSANRRVALGELAYNPRYLLLDPGAELDRALAFEQLEPMERALVMARARKLSAPVPVGAAQENMLRQWARPRPKTPAALPVHLSDRTASPEPEPARRLCFFRRSKRLKQPNFEPPLLTNRVEPPKESCCTCFGNGILRAFICLFD